MFKKKPFNKKDDGLTEQERIESEIRRIKLPRGNQTLGMVTRMLGSSRMEVKCFDGKTRICRTPGRLKRRLWIKQGFIVIVEPWEYSGDEKGDIIFKYTPTQVKYLKSKGHLKALEEIEGEF